MPVSDVFSQYAQPVRSIADFSNALNQQAAAQQAAQLGQIQLLKAHQDMADQAATRNALAGLQPMATDDDRINALKGTNTPAGYAAADALAKAAQARMESQSKVGLDAAHAADYRATTAGKVLTTAKDLLPQVQNPQQAGQWVDALYSNPATAEAMKALGTPEEAKGRIPTDPAQFQTWVQQQAMGMDKYITDQTQKRGQDMTAGTAANRLTEETRNHRVTEGISGANLALARTRETREAAAPKGVLTQTDNGPVLVDPRTGAATPVMMNGAAIGPRAEKLKDVPPTVNAKVIETRQSISNIDSAIDAAKKNPGAFGISNAIPGMGTIKQMGGDQDAIGARAQVANIGSLTLHDRSGAAVSASEFPRLQPFIPSASDNADAVVTKLTKMKKIAEEELGLYSETYGEGSGYKPIRVPSGSTSGNWGLPAGYKVEKVSK